MTTHDSTTATETQAHPRSKGFGLSRRWRRRMRQTGKGLLLTLLAILACAALLRTVVALLEAAALLTLALVTASLALPRGLGWYWRQAQGQIPSWLQRLADALIPRTPAPSADRKEV